MNKFIFSILFCALAASASAAWLDDLPQTLVQPNGDTVRCFASGDEYYHWLHDKDDYTITKDAATGYWVYATVNVDKIGSSGHVVGTLVPEAAGLTPGIRISNDEYQLRRSQYPDHSEIASSPHTGTINHVVIFVRFAGESNFQRSHSAFLNQFNNDTPGNVSVLNFFQEASYDQFDVVSHLYPNPFDNVQLSFQDSLPRGYYQPYDATTNPIGYDPESSAQRKGREHRLLRGAVAYADSYIQDTLQVDRDNDNIVDNITFIIRDGPDGWGNLLWAHRWTLSSYNVQLNGARVFDYAFMFENSLDVGIGTMCHEMFHVLGAPDLYHYDSTYGHLNPVGSWGLMETQGNPPHHMLAHMKEKYGWWMTIPTLTTGGYRTLNPLTSPTNNSYRLYSPFSPDEHWVVEYRQDIGPFEVSIPDSGLLIYRVRPSLNGNAGGPPDEVYIYRPGGTTTVDGNVDNAEYCANEGRVHINNLSSPTPFLNNGSNGGLFIADIGYVGNTIEFFYAPDYDPIGGAVSGVWDSGNPSTGYCYWMVSNTYASTGNTLTVKSGSRIYIESGRNLSAIGEVLIEQGIGWTRLQTVDRYKTGIKTKGGIRLTNGGLIRFH